MRCDQHKEHSTSLFSSNIMDVVQFDPICFFPLNRVNLMVSVNLLSFSQMVFGLFCSAQNLLFLFGQKKRTWPHLATPHSARKSRTARCLFFLVANVSLLRLRRMSSLCSDRGFSRLSTSTGLRRHGLFGLRGVGRRRPTVPRWDRSRRGDVFRSRRGETCSRLV